MIKRMVTQDRQNQISLRECFSLLWSACKSSNTLRFEKADSPSKFNTGPYASKLSLETCRSPASLANSRDPSDARLSPSRDLSKKSCHSPEYNLPTKKKVSFAKELEIHGPDFNTWRLPANYDERKQDSPTKIPKMFQLKRESLLTLHKPVKLSQKQALDTTNIKKNLFCLEQKIIGESTSRDPKSIADTETEQDSSKLKKNPSLKLNLNFSNGGQPRQISSANTSRSGSNTPRVCLSGREQFSPVNKLKPVVPAKGESLRSMNSNSSARSMDLRNLKRTALNLSNFGPKIMPRNLLRTATQEKEAKPAQSYSYLNDFLFRPKAQAKGQIRFHNSNKEQYCQASKEVLDLQILVPHTDSLHTSTESLSTSN